MVLLPHDQREPPTVGVLTSPGDVTHYVRFAGGGADDAREQFERGRLAGAVGAKKGDEFARFDLQVDRADRLHVAVLAAGRAALTAAHSPSCF